MTRQREILLQIAKKHGVNIGQAEEVWNLFGAKIAEIISSTDKKTNELFDSNKFPVIHIDHLGKFIPNQRKIRHSNYCIDLKTKTDEHNL
jgi:hypothetical protein